MVMMPPLALRMGRRPTTTTASSSASSTGGASCSIMSDTASVEGQLSLAPTVHSHDTVKASNRRHGRFKTPLPPPSPARSTDTPISKSIEKDTSECSNNDKSDNSSTSSSVSDSNDKKEATTNSPKQNQQQPEPRRKRWTRKLRNLVRGTSGASATPPAATPTPSLSPSSTATVESNSSDSAKVDNMLTQPRRQHSQSEDGPASKTDSELTTNLSESYPMKRVISADTTNPGSEVITTTAGGKVFRSTSPTPLDAAIRGRRDGVDCLSLYPVHTIAFPPMLAESKEDNIEDPTLTDVELLKLSFTAMPTTFSCAEMVTNMMWLSAGNEHPEIILEGFIPGGEDRWTVQMEKTQAVSSPTASPPTSPSRPVRKPSIEPTQCNEVEITTTIIAASADPTATISDDGSFKLPSYKLWDRLWGDQSPPPKPTHLQDETANEGETKSDGMMELAAACSVPVDLDEDTFIIEGAGHFRSVHDLVMVPIQRRRFDSALLILNKLLKGLETSAETRLAHLIGSTHHNIGMIHLLQGQFQQALKSFHLAVLVRSACLPVDHPDIVVSLVRVGMAEFALERFGEAIHAFVDALKMTKTRDGLKAKILNNLGVAHFMQCQTLSSDSLEAFASALEIQRELLDAPIRRGNTIYESAVTLSNMAKVYWTKKDYDLSYFVCEEAFLLQSTAFRKDHDIILASLGNLGLSKARSNDIQKAIQIFESILRTQVLRFGSDSQQAAETRGMIAYLNLKQQDYIAAKKGLNRVKRWQERYLPRSHPSIKLSDELFQAISTAEEGGDTPVVWV